MTSKNDDVTSHLSLLYSWATPDDYAALKTMGIGMRVDGTFFNLRSGKSAMITDTGDDAMRDTIQAQAEAGSELLQRLLVESARRRLTYGNNNAG